VTERGLEIEGGGIQGMIGGMTSNLQLGSTGEFGGIASTQMGIAG
jgi:hypothetical protein